MKYWIVLLLSSALFLTACGDPNKRVCNHMASMAEEAGEETEEGEIDECVEMMEHLDEECSNPNDVRGCILDLETMDDFVDCLTVCEQTEDEEESE